MTDLEKSDGAMLKTGEMGHVPTLAVRRESLLDEFERTGLTDGVDLCGGKLRPKYKCGM